MTDSVTLREWLDHCVQAMQKQGVYLGHGTDNYWDEAVHLVLPRLGISLEASSDVLRDKIPSQRREQLAQDLHQRIVARRPVAYITGEAWFAGLPFVVTPAVLIPRSPIAELIHHQFRPWLTQAPKLALDLCCGSGCIGIAMAYWRPELVVEIADISPAALQVAATNIERYGLTGRVTRWQSDLLQAIPAAQQYDLVVTNPPYVDACELCHMPAEYRHEPRMALAAGDDGLDVVRRILACAEHYLSEEGLLVVEVGKSSQALERAFPNVPFTWVEFAHGGEGVFVLSAKQLRQHRQAFNV